MKLKKHFYRRFLHILCGKSVSLTLSNNAHNKSYTCVQKMCEVEKKCWHIAFELSEVNGESEEWLHFWLFSLPRAIMKYILPLSDASEFSHINEFTHITNRMV